MQARVLWILPSLVLCSMLAPQPLRSQVQDLSVHPCGRMPLAYVFSAHPPRMRTPQDVADHLRKKVNFRIWWIHRHVLAFLTMKFKYIGITGWTNLCSEAYAVGRVEHADRSNDGFYTVDLALREFQVAEKETELNGPRFIRVEIRPKVRREVSFLPRAGQTVQVWGRLFWDGDGSGFLEIHPRHADDVQIEGTSVQRADK